MKLIASLLLATTFAVHAEVKVAVGDISDNRSTGKAFTGLSVELKVSGVEMAECKAMRVVLKDAKDDAGNAIPTRKNSFNDSTFKAPQKTFGGFKREGPQEYQLKLDLENPARSAKSLTVDAAVELLIPSKDPNAVITANVATEAGKPLAHEALKTAGVTIMLQESKDDKASYTIVDPRSKVANVEFCSADGKPLETSGRFSSGFNGSKSVTINLRAKAPAGMQAKIYLQTDKSILTIPVKLTSVALP
ncbi:MAG TPA: hypothetical protein VGH19_05390 [Verrucomicrobiae bacterium]